MANDSLIAQAPARFTYDLGSAGTDRQLNSFTVYVANGDPGRNTFLGAVQVSEDNVVYRTVGFRSNFQGTDGASSFNKTSFTFAPNEATNFRYVRLVSFTPTTFDTNNQPRLVETDATLGAATAPLTVSTTLLNLNTNVANTSTGEQGPGRVTSVTASSNIGGDNPGDAFGDIGGVEPTSFIFANQAQVDNGNATIDPATETIQSLTFNTDSAVTLSGLRLSLLADNPNLVNANRSTQLVRLSVDGTPVSVFRPDGGTGTVYDNNGLSTFADLVFANGALSGSQFLLEFTSPTGAGLRLDEVDALVAVPEPAGLSLVALAVAGLLARRRRA